MNTTELHRKYNLEKYELGTGKAIWGAIWGAKAYKKSIKQKIFLDTEFIDNGKTIELISIALVKSNGESLYCVSNQFNKNNLDTWLIDNVIANLGDVESISRQKIKEEILRFIGTEKTEFWAYYSSYDWVAFCQLFGKMLDLPSNYAYYCNDLKQLANSNDFDTKTIKDDGKHNALSDALWNKEVYEAMNNTCQK